MHFHRIHSFTCYLQSGIEHTSLLTSSDYFKDIHTSSKKYDWQLSFVVSCHHHPSRKSPLSHDFFSKTTKIKCVFVLSHVCTHSCLIVDAFLEVIFFFAWKWFLSLDILDYESPSFFSPKSTAAASWSEMIFVWCELGNEKVGERLFNSSTSWIFLLDLSICRRMYYTANMMKKMMFSCKWFLFLSLSLSQSLSQNASVVMFFLLCWTSCLSCLRKSFSEFMTRLLNHHDFLSLRIMVRRLFFTLFSLIS